MKNKRAKETYWTHFIMEAYCGYSWGGKKRKNANICNDPSIPEVKKCIDRNGKMCLYLLWCSVDKEERVIGTSAIMQWGRVWSKIGEIIEKGKTPNVRDLVDVMRTSYIKKSVLTKIVKKTIAVFAKSYRIRKKGRKKNDRVEAELGF